MHATSLENMQLCYQRHIAGSELERRDRVVVLDVGGADVNGSYAEVFRRPGFAYLGADLTPGPGVDVVLQEPTRLPLDDACADIVISGQMLEHCEFFWLTFAEMVRVLRPGGFLFLIAPSAGPIHRYPVDCYRFYPDAYQALARYANCRLVETWLDERGPWKDLVGVFQRHALPSKPAASDVRSGNQPGDHSDGRAGFDPRTCAGADFEEVIAGDRPYLEVLGDLHDGLQPRLYLEIGVRHGTSLTLAGCPALGVDPAPEITEDLSPDARVLALTSDDFFRDHAAKELQQPPDLTFIDGMHLFEYVLRDFMHVERHSAPNGLVVLDDVFPNHPAQAERFRRTRAWAGDVWKIMPCLRQWRPDLLLLPINASPTGLLLVAGLDPKQKTLWDNYNGIVRQFQELSEPPEAILARDGCLPPSHPVIPALTALLAARRPGVPSPAELRGELRRVLAGHGLPASG